MLVTFRKETQLVVLRRGFTFEGDEDLHLVLLPVNIEDYRLLSSRFLVNFNSKLVNMILIVHTSIHGEAF